MAYRLQKSQHQHYILPEQPIPKGNFAIPTPYDQLSRASLQTPPSSPPPPYLSPPLVYQPQDLYPNHSSESTEGSDGPPPLEDNMSDFWV